MDECIFRKQVTGEDVWECLSCGFSCASLNAGAETPGIRYCPRCGAEITTLERTIYNREDDVTTIVSEDYK